MDSLALASLTGDPIQLIGQAFYFDAATVAEARARGLNPFEYYGLGRGGTLGDVDVAEVIEAFTFFHPRSVDRFWTQAKSKADAVATADAYLLSAYAYADRTFGALDVTSLRDFAAAAHKVASAVSGGHHKLVDGYKRFPVPEDPVHAAYFGAILLRELRGCVHIDAVKEVGLSAVEAVYLQDLNLFKLHGYTEDEVPESGPELSAKKATAEVLTNEKMAACFEVLSVDERQHLADGALAMQKALDEPVPVG